MADKAGNLKKWELEVGKRGKTEEEQRKGEKGVREKKVEGGREKDKRKYRQKGRY